MRVLFVSHTFPLEGEPLSNVGGMQRLAVEQEAALAARPDVELVSLVLRSSSRWTPARTLPFLARCLVEIPRRVRRDRVQVVLFSSMVTAALAPLLRRRLPRSVLLAATPVGRDVTLPNPLHQRWVPRVFDALDLVLPISRATAEECLSRGLGRGRLNIVPCGIDTRRFPERGAREDSRQRLLDALRGAGQPPLPDDRALLLCSVGRHQERKGFHWFIEQVMPRLGDSACYLLGGSGPMTPRIRESVAKLGLQSRVRVLGQLSETMLLELFRGADLFVMPNVPVAGDIEGFGVVMLEAGLSGLPIVAAELEGIRDVVREGENGVLVPSGDADAFVAAIDSFAGNPARLQRASVSARSATVRRFSWEVVVQQYVGALTAALGDRGEAEALGRLPAPAAEERSIR